MRADGSRAGGSACRSGRRADLAGGAATASPRFAGRRRLALAAAVLATAGVIAPSALAANPHGKFLGVVGHRTAGPAATPNAGSAAGALAYNGGPVMHSDANYAIFWEPAGHTTTASYKSVIQSYFSSVAADSGKTSNVYSTDTEYYDVSGTTRNYIAYNASFGAALLDTQPYPTSGCPSQGGQPCLTDAQIAAEVNRVVTANHYPRGLGAVYYVFFPSAVDSCFGSTTSSCSFNYFCAYHSSFNASAGTTLYADMPYAAVPGCDPGERPTGDPADATLNVLSHENNETITDPLGNAWYDAAGNENGDKCNFTFGSALGGSSGSFYNQLISGHGFWLQEEWSNAAAGCLQRSGAAPPVDEVPTASFTRSPAGPTPGSPVGFDASASSDPDGTITAYSWSFGDGATASGAQPTHTYAAAGTYTVTLHVTDSSGLTASTTQSLTVATPTPTDESPTVTISAVVYAGTTSVRFYAAASDPDGAIRTYAWSFGDGAGSPASWVIHHYATRGTYTVTVTAKDSDGQATTARQVLTIP